MPLRNARVQARALKYQLTPHVRMAGHMRRCRRTVVDWKRERRRRAQSTIMKTAGNFVRRAWPCTSELFFGKPIPALRGVAATTPPPSRQQKPLG